MSRPSVTILSRPSVTIFWPMSQIFFFTFARQRVIKKTSVKPTSRKAHPCKTSRVLTKWFIRQVDVKQRRVWWV